MVKLKNFLVLFISTFYIFSLGFSAKVNEDRKDYIVYMGATSSDTYSVSSQHINVLQQVIDGISAEEAIVRSYKRSFNGFAARLTLKEYENLKGLKEVVSVFPSRTLQLQTTRSWEFLGIPEPTPKQQAAESDVIVGVIDTGIWPESPSFNDVGLGPVPKKWKGVCKGGQNFTCNRKVIGARVYMDSATSVRDTEGHGSHTASTIAGRLVANTSFFGIAEGTARGGVPAARIAVYKVCDASGCQETNILSAFDDAIADGVDVISISIGGQPAEFYVDSIAIGAFHSMAKGVLTVQSAGNDGSNAGTVASVAPWLFTVAASTTDRRIVDKVVLGNGKTLIGNAVNAFQLEGDKFPLVYREGATTDCDSDTFFWTCYQACIDKSKVKGKILVCDDTTAFSSALGTGALGVLGESRLENVSFVTPLPGASLTKPDMTELKSYLNSTKAPTVNLLKSESIVDKSAPIVAEFSSRGPNSIALDILKPDITAPGVDILAAFSPEASASDIAEDKRKVTYNVISGTSMACPHVAGAVAYLKSVHPDWSPAAIKSALMTTATPLSPANNPEAEFAYGSGQINPLNATNPGLVYETTQDDYISFLCKAGYDKSKIGVITGNTSVVCPKQTDQSPKDVNYPSMTTMIDTTGKSYTIKFTRTVTNVGSATSTYTAKVTSSAGLNVTVEPNTLSFKSLKESKSFAVTVAGKAPETNITIASASIIWSDGVHNVRSPIAVYAS